MTTLPVQAIGSDRLWKARLDRVLATRGDLSWLGARSPGERSVLEESPALLLLDGDDARVGHELDAWRTALPPRLYFYRVATVRSLQSCVRSGANGCLEKSASPEVLLRALRAVGAGLFAVEPPLLFRAVLDGWGELPPVDPAVMAHDPQPDLTHLTERQREIVHWAAQGLSNKQIARNLGISPETVKTHLHHVFERAGVSGRVALLAAQWANNGTARHNDALQDVD